jgi:hypothetical protein
MKKHFAASKKAESYGSKHPLDILNELFGIQLKNYYNAYMEANEEEPFLYSIQLIHKSIVGSVKFFITVMKKALIKFYRIGSTLRSQEDNLNQWITDYVLESKVSWILF